MDQGTSGEPHPSHAYHWGGDWKSATPLSKPRPLSVAVELRAKTIAASDKELFVLSEDGTVHKLTPSGQEKETHTHTVSL